MSRLRNKAGVGNGRSQDEHVSRPLLRLAYVLVEKVTPASRRMVRVGAKLYRRAFSESRAISTLDLALDF